MRRYLPLLVALLMLALSPSAASAASVSIGDNFFQPRTVTLNPGGSVTWTNEGLRLHSVTASRPSNYFNEDIVPTASYTRQFTAAGSFPYLCRFHSNMTGVVAVRTRATPTSGGLNTLFTIRVASASAPSGFRYVVQRRKDDGAWSVWRRITSATTTFDPSSRGRYQFRSALQRLSDGQMSNYSPAATVTVG